MTFVLFFVSGAAGLVYEVAWARSLGLVFGASHLAVATVLAVYMAGQALGGALLGRRADRTERPLRLYGRLEAGVAASAVVFIGLMRAYPRVYPALAGAAETSGVWLTLVRTAFSVIAMLLPATLMGGTLPVLARHLARGGRDVARGISLLYAVNTAGAVAGTVAAGFFLLRAIGVTNAILVAAAASAAVGAGAVALDRRAPPSPARSEEGTRAAADATPGSPSLVARLALLGIGVSGFCALGYEVLWTRMISLAVGTSVYAFAIMLTAFLAGIGAGSHAFALLGRVRALRPGGRGAALAFGASQLAVGAAALAVTVAMRRLPGAAGALQHLLVDVGSSEFAARTASSAAVAIAFMFVPAFFMGLAFPAAGAVSTAAPGATAGRLLAANTVGAILGSIASGFLLLPAFGIERALHVLIVANVAMGTAVALAVAAPRLVAIVPIAAALALVARGAFPEWGRAWDRKFFATYINNTRVADTPEQIAERLANTDVLYYFEGVNETVSAVKVKGGVQSFIVNGRPEASTYAGDVQVQKALGHLPMLLHRDPRRVFILGTGTGMTLGAASVHPEVQRLVLAEIEEGMLGVARTFARWNGGVLDDPKLSVVLNDGRNFLATTRERFDVISADPVHPWSGGAAYLYTREYFRSVSDRLAPGGIACQWLPMYELTPRDVKTVLRTFSSVFPHVMVWLTYYDAVLIGSRDPIVVDEAALERRLAAPAVRADLAPLHMATAEDLLSFFLMGTAGATAFSRDGDLNTDDDLVLEFSAPESQGIAGLDGGNVLALAPFRESVLPYLAPPASEADRRDQGARWTRHDVTGAAFDLVHGRFLQGLGETEEVEREIALLEAREPRYAPLLFLLEEREFQRRARPALVAAADLPVRTGDGSPGVLRISAVRQFMGHERVLVSFVDNARREIYGQRYLDGKYDRLEGDAARYATETLALLQSAAQRVPSSAGPADEAEVASALHALGRRVIGALPSQVGR